MNINSQKNQKTNVSVVSATYHVCVALLPVLCLINVPGINISFGTVLLIVFTPYSLFSVYKCLKSGRQRISSFFFLVFYAYMILRADGNTSRIILCIAVYINLFGMCCGSIQTDRIRKIIEIFAVLNFALIVLQIISYYGLHYRIQYIPQSLIHQEFKESYVFREFSGLYRPSALFLEPAHYAEYCCFALISVLFPNEQKADLKKAAVIGLGCILTTSGMGILITFGVFLWYIIFNKTSKGVKIISIMKWIPIIAICIFVLLQIPFFQTALQRVFSTVDGYNAISGRTSGWKKAIGSMHGHVWWFGYGNSAKYPYYLSGFPDTIYKFGIVGIVLQFMCFLHLILRKFDNFVWCCCTVFILMFCFAHLTSFYEQLFYFGIVVANAIDIPNRKIIRFKLRRV